MEPGAARGRWSRRRARSRRSDQPARSGGRVATITAMNPIYPAWLAQIPVLLFVFAFGACVGSFINVLAYRLPRGEDVIVPASRCPKCGQKLTWRENLPIVGWLLLRGRCRFCKDPISPEYPIVETLVAALFASLYALWFMQPSPFAFLGIDAQAARPEWTVAGLARMWPYFFTVLGLVGALVTMTIIDAKTFTIPLVVPWVIGALGLIVHPVHAWWYARAVGGVYLSGHAWTIPTGGCCTRGTRGAFGVRSSRPRRSTC